MNTPVRLVSVLASAVVLAAFGSSRLLADNFIPIQKGRVYAQTSSTGAVADLTYPFAFGVSSDVAASFTPPGGSSTALPIDTDGTFNYNAYYTTQAALDAAYPNGTYTLNVTGHAAFTLSLSGDLYPAIPQITGLSASASWNAFGQLVIDPTQSTTLNFSSFPTYNSSGVVSHVALEIHPYNGNGASLKQETITPTNTAPLASYTIAANALTPGCAYQCSLRYDVGSATNSTAAAPYTAVGVYTTITNFTIVTSGTAAGPQILTQPTAQLVQIGGTANFTLTASGSNGVFLQWFKNGTPIQGNPSANSPTLTLSNVQASDAANYYALAVDNNGRYTRTNAASLTIGASSLPTITAQPISRIVAVGSSVVFSVEAAGGGLSFQWKKDGANIPGATSSQLMISNAQSGNGGAYSLTVTNSAGSVSSNIAGLAVVTTTDPGRLVNASVRIVSGTGDNVLIVGFVAGGSGTTGSKQLLIRGIGPTLAGFGVPGTMADPLLQVIPQGSTTAVASNDNWGGNSTVVSVSNAVGAFALPDTNSKDSALVATLAGGPYSAKVSGLGNTTGTVLAELYDTTPGTFSPTAPRLINISARAASSNDNPLIAGFVIGGLTAKTVLIRAIGPTLTGFGVGGAMTDPKIELYINQSGSNTLLKSNDNWGGVALDANVASTVGAFALTDPASKDAVLLVTLDPGIYSANVLGVNNASGVALVEVYEVP